jgi:hypothetical protein
MAFAAPAGLSACRRRGGTWWPKPTFQLDGDSLVPTRRPGPVKLFVIRHSRLHEAWRRATWRATTAYAVGAPWRLNAAILRAVRDDCRAMGAALPVVPLPERGAWHRATATGEALARDGSAFLDLAAALPPEPAALYYRRDPHLSPSGHEWAAQAIAAEIVDPRWAQARSDSLLTTSGRTTVDH